MLNERMNGSHACTFSAHIMRLSSAWLKTFVILGLHIFRDYIAVMWLMIVDVANWSGKRRDNVYSRNAYDINAKKLGLFKMGNL